jgi:hypothetical protein
MNQILINQKNPTEVLACVGILALDAALFAQQVTRCRFVRVPIEKRVDGELCGMVFEFDHPDFGGFVQKCGELVVQTDGIRVNLSRNGNSMPLDWSQFAFIGDSGNFAQANTTEFVQRHLEVFKQQAVADRNMFAQFVTVKEPNFLSGMNLKKNYIDAGGVYEPANRVYTRELFLIVALQLCQNMIEKAVRSWRLEYSLCTQWTTFGGLVAALSSRRHDSLFYVSKVMKFGKGKVLSIGQEDARE